MHSTHVVYENVWVFLVPFLSEKVPIEIVHFQSFCNNNIRHRRLNYGPISWRFSSVKSLRNNFLCYLIWIVPPYLHFVTDLWWFFFLQHNDFWSNIILNLANGLTNTKISCKKFSWRSNDFICQKKREFNKCRLVLNIEDPYRISAELWKSTLIMAILKVAFFRKYDALFTLPKKCAEIYPEKEILKLSSV